MARKTKEVAVTRLKKKGQLAATLLSFDQSLDNLTQYHIILDKSHITSVIAS